MKPKELTQLKEVDKKVFESFGHSWACGDKIEDCMCQGGTFWNEVARPIVEQSLINVRKEEKERIIKIADKMFDNNMKDTSEALAYRTALRELIEKIK